MHQAGLFGVSEHLKRLFREKLTEAGALDTQFADFDRQLKERG